MTCHVWHSTQSNSNDAEADIPQTMKVAQTPMIGQNYFSLTAILNAEILDKSITIATMNMTLPFAVTQTTIVTLFGFIFVSEEALPSSACFATFSITAKPKHCSQMVSHRLCAAKPSQSGRAYPNI